MNGVALVLLGLALGAPGLSAPAVTTLPDGLELVVWPVAHPTVAVRLVVRAGGSHDPPGRDGLAHLLEHVIHHGSYLTTEVELEEALRRAGADHNAFTTPSFTYYVLDVPRPRFEESVALWLEVLTNPALTLAAVDRELKVIDVEASYFDQRGLLQVADLVLFPGAQSTRPVIGSTSTRRRITQADLVQFYQRHYTPSNATVIVVGDVDPDAVARHVEGLVRWPPMGLDPNREPPPIEPNVPVNQPIAAEIPAIVFGYAITSGQRDACVASARLAQIRIYKRVVAEEGLTPKVFVECMALRGHDFLLAAVATRSFRSVELPGMLKEEFAALAHVPLRPSELALLRRRTASEWRSLSRDPSQLAARLVEEVGYEADPRRADTLARLGKPLRLDPRQIARLARSFRADREVRVILTPFQY